MTDSSAIESRATVRPRVWNLAAFIVGYIFSGSVGEGLAIIPGISITFWPPVGVLIAALLLTAPSSWPWWIGCAGVAELICNAMWFHNPFHLALIYFAANALEAWTGTWLALRWMRTPSRWETLDEVLIFLIAAAGLAPMVSATIIATTDALIGKHPFFTAWPLVWLGDSSGILVSTPLTYVAIQTWRDRSRLSIPLLIEAISLGALIALVAGLAFKGILPTAYLALPPLLWTAVRFHLKGAAVALAFLTLVTASFTARGQGEFTGHLGWSSQRTVMLQTFLAISAVSTLVVATLSSQRQKALFELQTVNSMLERRVRERTNAIRQSEERLRLANQASQTGIVEWNARGDDGYWSDEACELFGHPPGTIPNYARWKENIHPDDLAHAEETVSQAFAEAESQKFAVYRSEFRVRKSDDRITWLLSTGELRLTPEGIVLRGVVQDITSRRQAELALLKTAASLNRERERLSLALVAGQLGVYEWNLQTQVLWWSPETFLLFGLNGSTFEPTFETFRSLVHPDDWDELWNKTQTSIDQREIFAHEYRIIRPDGTIRWVYNRSKIELDQEGEPLLITGVAGDVSDAKEIEQALARQQSLLQSANAALQDADRKKDEFLATLAHELRNPLAPIRNGLQLMRLSKHDPATVEQAHAMMERQLKQMVRLIDDLLDVSRISRGKLTLQIRRIPLAMAIRNAVDTSRSLLLEKSHHLLLTMPDEAIEVDGDETRLSQVFANLLNNAAKYTDPGGQIRVTTVCHENTIQVTIEDNGTGIPPEMLERIFDMFTQVDHSLEKSQGGLGIGLNIVHRLVELHGGTVTAHSEGPGHGSRFVVTLPVSAHDEHAAHDMAPTSTLSLSPPRHRILIVDDNRDAATTLAMMLRATGAQTQMAHDGIDAIAIAEQFRPDVVVLDLGMPKLNGYDTCRRIRQQPWGREMLLVALSGWGQEEDKRKSQAAGFNAHLVKPVEFSQLQQVLLHLTSSDGALFETLVNTPAET